jgi:hypothetical protein
VAAISNVGDSIPNQCGLYFCVQNSFSYLLGPDIGWKNHAWLFSQVRAHGWSALPELSNQTNSAKMAAGQARFPQPQRLRKVKVERTELLGLLCAQPADKRVPLGKYLIRVRQHANQHSTHVIAVDTVNRIIMDPSPVFPLAMPLSMETFAKMDYVGTDGGCRLRL